MKKARFPVLRRDELGHAYATFVNGYSDGINLYYKMASRLWYAIVPGTGLAFRRGKTLTEVSNDPSRPKAVADYLVDNMSKLCNDCKRLAIEAAALEASKSYFKIDVDVR